MEENCVESCSFGEVDKSKSWDYAIVVQGPYYPEWTPVTLRILLERNNNCLIIISTYAGFILSDFEKENLSPSGRLLYIFVKTPDKELFPDFWRTNHQNQNLQRLSSFVGIRYAKELGIPNVLKMRTDIILGRRNLCEFLNEISEVPLILPKDYSLDYAVKKRIVVCDQTIRANGKYFVCDKFYFGETDDLLIFFDIRAGCAWNGGRGVKDDCKEFPEVQFTETWMKNIGIRPTPDDLMELVARFLGIVNTVDVEYVFQKFEGSEKYLKHGKSWIQQDFLRYSKFFNFTSSETWREWMKLY